jgi:hypothetical protein
VLRLAYDLAILSIKPTISNAIKLKPQLIGVAGDLADDLSIGIPDQPC